MNNGSLKSLRKMDYWPDSKTYRIFEALKNPKQGLNKWQRTTHFFKMLKYIFTPFAVLIPVFSVGSEEIEKTAQQRWINIILSALLGLAVVISVIKIDYFQHLFGVSGKSSATIKDISLYYLKYGIISNLVVLIWLFPYWKNIELLRFIWIETDQIVKNTGALIGDRLWCENNTNTLLKHIIDKAHDERAKWHLINFLANLADEHVKPNGEKWLSLSTKADSQWHVSRYSKFLSDNIDHSENEILWIVDPVDFYEVLLPDCIAYSIAAIGIEELDLPQITWGKTKGLDEIFEPMREAAEQLSNSSKISKETYHSINLLMSSLRCSALKLPSYEEVQRTYEWWDDFNSLFLPNLVKIGELLIASVPSLVSEKVINSGFWKLHRHWLDKCFPHIGALRKARVQKANRIIYIPKTNFSDGSRSIIETKADYVAIEQFSHKLWNRLGSTWSNDLVSHALKLFSEITGGPNRVKVYVSNSQVEDESKSKYDLGVYDKNFIVQAIQLNEKEKREVTWYHIDSSDKDNHPPEIKELLKILYDSDNTAHEITAANGINSYEMFCNLILKHRP